MLLRAAAVAAAVATAATLGAGRTAHAIETKDVGLEPVPTGDDGGRQSLRVEIIPGREATDAVRVWNKTDRPLTVDLLATAAKKAGDGSVSLGGDAAPASWIDVEHGRITLPPKGERVIAITVRPPEALPALETTAAIMVQPVSDAAAPPAILQRVAVMTYLSASSLHAPPATGTRLPVWLIVIAVLLAVAAAALAGRRVLSLRVATAPVAAT